MFLPLVHIVQLPRIVVMSLQLFAKIEVLLLIHHKGMPSFQKSAVFLNIVQKAFDPPPFYLNICPILQGVFLDPHI